jgi:hypothetical protein
MLSFYPSLRPFVRQVDRDAGAFHFLVPGLELAVEMSISRAGMSPNQPHTVRLSVRYRTIIVPKQCLGIGSICDSALALHVRQI